MKDEGDFDSYGVKNQYSIDELWKVMSVDQRKEGGVSSLWTCGLIITDG